LLTLYTTPVVYIYLDRLRLWWVGARAKHRKAVAVAGLEA
jgi:multidrug efflux pump